MSVLKTGALLGSVGVNRSFIVKAGGIISFSGINFVDDAKIHKLYKKEKLKKEKKEKKGKG